MDPYGSPISGDENVICLGLHRRYRCSNSNFTSSIRKEWEMDISWNENNKKSILKKKVKDEHYKEHVTNLLHIND